MLIRLATVRDFAVLKGPVSARFAPGLNVIYGPNESGKSTLLEAIWSGLTLRSRVTGQRLERISPRGGGIPCVELVFEHQGLTFVLVKVFNGPRGETRLNISGGGETTKLDDDEAENALRDALGLGTRAGMARSGSEHLGIWPLLWVRQGESSLPPSEALFEDGKRSLGDRLASLAGEVLAGSGSEAVFSAVRSEYLRFFTEKTGHDRVGADSILAGGGQQVEEARQRLDEVESRQRQYEDDVDRFVELTRELDNLERVLPDREMSLQQLEGRSEQARSVKERLTAARAEMEAAAARCEQAKERLAQRKTTELDLETAKQRVLTEDARIEDFEEKLAIHERDLEKRQQLVEARRSETETADGRVRHLRLHIDLRDCRSRTADAERRLVFGKQHRQRIENIEAQLDDLPLNASTMAELERLNRDYERAAAVVDAASAAMRLTAAKPLTLKIGRRRVELDAGEEWSERADGPVDIDIDGIARLEVVPGDLEVGTVRNQAIAAEKAMRKRLRELGLKSLGEARRIDEARHRFEAQLRDEQRLLELVSVSTSADTHEDLAAWREQAAALESELESLRVLFEQEIPSDSRSLLALQAEMERTLKQARSALEQAQIGRAQHGADKERLLGQLAVAEADRQSALERAKTLEVRLEESSNDTASAPLQAVLETEGDRHTKCRRAFDDIEKELEALGGEKLEAMLTGARTELESARNAISAKQRERDHLEGRLTAANLIGLHEQLAAAQAHLERTEATHEPVRRRAEALKLLYETISRCRDTARQSVVEPLRHAVEPLVSSVFGTTKVSFDEQFAVERISRSDVDDAFDQLSGGAREQLALLVRLGMARVLADEQPLTVMLDDALVATDEMRFEGMVRALFEVVDPIQILLFTCQWERYRSVAPGRINGVDLVQLKEEGKHLFDP